MARLSQEELDHIRAAILSCVLPRWQKVAMIVTRAQEKLQEKYPKFSIALCAEQIRLLAQEGKLDSQGNLRYLRFSEIKLPSKDS